jgi:hypothetical protein
MVTLTYQDVLELLGYAASDRRLLEILGYACSTRGVRQFRQERPDFIPQLCQIIQASLEETGQFPRQPSQEVLNEGTYLEKDRDGVISLHKSVEISVSQTARVRKDFASAREAIIELLRLSGNPTYLTGSGVLLTDQPPRPDGRTSPIHPTWARTP